MTVWLYLIYCVIIILILVFTTLAIVYKQHLKDCSEPSNPWCYNDWLCNINNNISPDLLNSMKNAGIVSQDAVPGSAYNLKAGIVDHFQAQCNTDNIYDENGQLDDSKIVLLNPITGDTCLEISSTCKIIPRGCTQNLYGEKLNDKMIWGNSTDFS